MSDASYTYKVDPTILTRVYCKVNAVGAKWQHYHDFPTIAEAREAVEILNSYKESDDLQAVIDRQTQEIAALKAESAARKLLADIHGRRMLKAEQAARALYAALQMREHCAVCGGVGTIIGLDYLVLPCSCRITAGRALDNWEEWAKGEGTDE